MTLLKVEDIDMTRYLVDSLVVERNDLRGDDTGRNMKGEMLGTLVGYFPTVTAKLKFDNKDQVSDFQHMVEGKFFTIHYYDTRHGKVIPLEVYTAPIKSDLVKDYLVAPVIECKFIAAKKDSNKYTPKNAFK